MKTLNLFVALVLITAVFYSCQKDETESISEIGQDVALLKTEAADCTTHCIDPENPVWFKKTDQVVVGWAGPDKDRFSKTVDIVYYNTLENFVLKVKSTEDIANLLVDGNIVKDFSNPIPAGIWHTITFELDENWEVCDDYSFQLQVIGNGP
ncbi:MAG: hypothetical protein K0B37_18175, partial [Bacteroidales bacterium]|nr:hypothetical protein [Bacteroidales bacterium]